MKRAMSPRGCRTTKKKLTSCSRTLIENLIVLSQQFSHFLCDPTLHYSVHSIPIGLIVKQVNPVNIPKFYFKFNLILSLHQRLNFPSDLQVYLQSTACFSILPHTSHMLPPPQFTIRLMVLTILLKWVLKL